jgi:UDP-3-O-[3-hydroxymyristoyl] glucosamine N-acyltransferase
VLLSNMLAGLPAEVIRDVEVAGFGPLTMAGEGLLHYFSDPRFAHQLASLCGSRAVLTTRDLAERIPEEFGAALCDNPKETFLKAYRLHGAAIEMPAPFPNEIDPSARIHPRAVIADHSVRIGARVSIGANAVIHERVTIEDDVSIGANSVLGGDGFEVGVVDGRQIVVPHYGSVLVRRGAVIQSNVSVDWGIYGGCTEIGEDTVLDNLVHVAHNVKIGRNCQIIACVMLGGSTVIGDEARIGPNATVSNGLRIGRGARITLGAVVTRDVEEGGHVTGNFAIPHRQFMNNLRKVRS